MFGEQSSLFAPMVERPSRAATCKLLMPLPEETRLYMGQHQIGSAPEYRMDRSGNLYMYLERLNAAVEAEGVFACDAGGHPPVFSAVCEGTRFLPVYTYEEAVERLENAWLLVKLGSPARLSCELGFFHAAVKPLFP